jgi:hypothetical protein
VTRARSRAWAYIASFALVWACGGTATDNTRSGAGGTGGPCKLNSDCPGTLVCGDKGLCVAECQASRDCPANQRCVLSAAGDGGSGSPVCQLIVETRCVYASDCTNPLVCAADFQCRNECRDDRDCVGGQVCAYGACAEPVEVGPDGTLIGATDAGTGPGKPR